MIEEIRKIWCDACGKEIEGYRCGINIIEFDDEGFPLTIGRTFCEECAISFQRWLKERRATNPKKSFIDNFK